MNGDEVDRVVESAIAGGYFPSAVVLVLHAGRVAKHAAYGYACLWRDARTRLADPVPAQPDTVYDLASLTKLFTATATMQLVEAGELDLDEAVSHYLPAFGQNGKAGIAVRHLLDHSSGLPPWLPLAKLPGGAPERLAAVDAVEPEAPTASRHIYGDLNYIVLGRLVELAGGQPLDQYVRDHILVPLGMTDTGYRPPASLQPRIAATEDRTEEGRGMVRGEVHDGNARALGGVAGHAGLFGTAGDLVAFARAMLSEGAGILRPETVRAMTGTPSAIDSGHGLGWEVGQERYMGALTSPRTWGHTGFTGTSLVVDARRRLAVILLTNRVHPTRNGPAINPVRAAVANAAGRLAGVLP